LLLGLNKVNQTADSKKMRIPFASHRPQTPE